MLVNITPSRFLDAVQVFQFIIINYQIEDRSGLVHYTLAGSFFT